MTGKEIIQEYSKFAPYYYYIGNVRGHFKAQIKFLSNLLDKHPIVSVLDAACATGDVINELCRKFPLRNFYGSDICDALLLQAKEKKFVKKTNIKKSAWTDLSSKFASSKMDLIFILGNSIAHVSSFKELERVFYNVNTLLKPGGQFVCDSRNWKKNIANNSFNEPTLKSSLEVSERDISFKYFSKYFFRHNLHHLSHIIQFRDRKNIEVNLTFLDVSSVNLVSILERTNFSDIVVEEDYSKYPFISIKAKKYR